MSPHLPPGMRHVERAELYESLQARLTYLQDFLEFGPADIDALRKGQPFIKTLIPALSQGHFFKKIMEQDITAQALLTHTTKEPTTDLDPDDFYGPNSSNMMNRHMFVRWYLTKLNSDPTTTAYWEYMNMVGAMHAGHARRLPLHVDVIHFSVLLGYVQTVLNDAIISSPTLPTPQKAPLVKAWGKLFWIQSDLFTKWHVRDGDGYDLMSARATKLDEGTRLEGGMRDERGGSVECPFREMARLDTPHGKKEGYAYMSAAASTASTVSTASTAATYTPPMSPMSMPSPTSAKRMSYAKGGIGSIHSISAPWGE